MSTMSKPSVCFQATGREVMKRNRANVCEMHQLLDEVRPSSHPSVSSATWQDVQERCRTHPAEISLLDARGRSCLHAACAKKAPLSVIREMLECCGNQRCLALGCDKHGKTPLSLAISSGVSVDVARLLLHYDRQAASKTDVLMQNALHLACGDYDGDSLGLIKTLLDAHPSAVEHESHDGKTPLHVAIESRLPLSIIQELVNAAPQSVVKNDSCGLIPLFVALQYGSSPDVIQFLVNVYPESTSVRDHVGQYPLFRAIENRASIYVQECLCTHQHVALDVDIAGRTALHLELASKSARPSTVALLLGTAPEISVKPNNAGETPLCLALRSWQQFCSSPRRVGSRVEQYWQCLALLMITAHYQEYGDESRGYFVLHAAVGCEMPRDVILHCLERYPNQANSYDVMGRLPLQAALNPSGWRHVQRISCIDTHLDLKRTTVMQLLHMHPSSVNHCDEKGRTMMALAAAGTSLSIPIFRALWGCPSVNSLRLRDEQTRLFPFQIAALPKKSLPRLKYEGITRFWWEREDLLQLDIIYVLLKQAPELIAYR